MPDNRTNKEWIEDNNDLIDALKIKANSLLPNSDVIDDATAAIININGEEV